MKEIEDVAGQLTGTEVFPCRLAPKHWKTAFVAGTAVLGFEKELLLAAIAGCPAPQSEMLVLDGDSKLWRKAEAVDGRSVLWLDVSGGWFVRYEVQEDVCLCARQYDGPLPDVEEFYWLSAGGALAATGFEPTLTTERIDRMKERYEYSALRLGSERHRVRELSALTAAALESAIAPQQCRAIGGLLHRMRLVTLPVKSVNVILGLVEALAFWPEAEERVLWSEGVLRELDSRRDDVLELRAPEVRHALHDLMAALRVATDRIAREG